MTDTSREPIQVPTDLPPGAHPLDQSAPWEPQFDSNRPVPGDTPGHGQRTRRKPWHTMSEDAFPVFQRAAYDWRPGTIVVTATTQPILIAPRQAGRVNLKIWVPPQSIVNGIPTATPAGIMLGSEPAEATTSNCILNVGDSIEIETEASAWAGLIPGFATGYAQFAVLVNPIGGELGIY